MGNIPYFYRKKQRFSMNCHDVENLIHMEIDQRLPQRASLALHEHLLSCERCAQLYAEYQELHALLSAELPAVEPPADFTAQVMAVLPAEPVADNIVALPAQQAAATATPRKKRRPTAWIAVVAAAAALVAGAALGGWFNNSDLQKPGAELIADVTPEDTHQAPGLNVQPPVFPDAQSGDSVDTPEETVTPDVPDSDPTVDTPETTVTPSTGTDQPAENTPPQPYESGISLPVVAYSNEAHGSYSLITLASYADYNAILPHLNGNSITYYIKQDSTCLEWQVELNGGAAPIYVGIAETLPGAAGTGRYTDNNGYVASSPNGQYTAYNLGGEQAGLYVGATLESAVRVAEQGGGNLISWCANSGKVLFNDAAGYLYLYYPAENLTLPVFTGYVGSACWSADGTVIIFSGYDATTGHDSIFQISVP